MNSQVDKNEVDIAAALCKAIDGSVPISPQALVRTAENNAVLHTLFCTQKIDKSEPHIATKRQKLIHLETQTRHFMKTLMARLSPDDNPYLTIKSFLPFPYLDSNIDVVAPEPNRFAKLRFEVKEMGFRRYRNLADIREPMKEMYCRRTDDRQVRRPCVHLHKAISWNGLVYVDGLNALNRCRFLEWNQLQIPIPAVEDEILILAAHAMFENKYLTLADLLHLHYLSMESPDWNYVSSSAEAYSWGLALRKVLGIARELANRIGIHMTIPASFPEIEIAGTLNLPHILSRSTTVPATLDKLRSDFRKGRISKAPRAIFTFLLVDPFWMYYKARRK